MHAVGKKEMVQGYYSGNFSGAIVLKCVSTKGGGCMNLDDFWNQSSNDFCWNLLEMGGFFKDKTLYEHYYR